MPEMSNNGFKEKKKNKELSFFRKYGSLLLSHHPKCESFKNHTLKLGSLHFCIGCFIGYPTAIITILLFNIFEIYSLFDSVTLLYVGILFLSSFLLSPLNLTNRKGIKILQKFCIGFGSAFLFWWIWTLTTQIFVNLITFIGIFGAIIVMLNGFHAYSFLKTCRKCKYKTNWHDCPGFNKSNNQNTLR